MKISRPQAEMASYLGRAVGALSSTPEHACALVAQGWNPEKTSHPLWSLLISSAAASLVAAKPGLLRKEIPNHRPDAGAAEC